MGTSHLAHADASGRRRTLVISPIGSGQGGDLFAAFGHGGDDLVGQAQAIDHGRRQTVFSAAMTSASLRAFNSRVLANLASQGQQGVVFRGRRGGSHHGGGHAGSFCPRQSCTGQPAAWRRRGCNRGVHEEARLSQTLNANMQHQVIHIHPAAPPKPPEGPPAMAAGCVACKPSPAPGVVVSRRWSGACRALVWSQRGRALPLWGAGAGYVGARPGVDGRKAPLWRRLWCWVHRMIAAGVGCDAAYEAEAR